MYQLGESGGGGDGRRVRGRKHCICSLCGVWRLAASGTDPSAVRRPASCMHQWSPAQHEKGQLPLETRWQNDVFAAVYTEPASGSLSLCVDIHRRASTFNLTKCQTLCCFTFRRLPCWEEGEHVLLLQLHGGSVVVFFVFSLGVIPHCCKECEAWRIMQLLLWLYFTLSLSAQASSVTRHRRRLPQET